MKFQEVSIHSDWERNRLIYCRMCYYVSLKRAMTLNGFSCYCKFRLIFYMVSQQLSLSFLGQWKFHNLSTIRNNRTPIPISNIAQEQLEHGHYNTQNNTTKTRFNSFFFKQLECRRWNNLLGWSYVGFGLWSRPI